MRESELIWITSIVIVCVVLFAAYMLFFPNLFGNQSSFPRSIVQSQEMMDANLQSQISTEVSSNFPNLPDTERQTLVQKQTDEFIEAHHQEYCLAVQRQGRVLVAAQNATDDAVRVTDPSKLSRLRRCDW